jgi:glycosyltransferase involved in cell wall biosynthesis
MRRHSKNDGAGKTVCMLTSVHAPYDVRIYEKEARSLAAAGYQVTIVAPHGKNEEREGVRIIGVQCQSNRRQRMTTVIWDVYRKARDIDAAVYHFHDPELMPVGLLLKLHRKQVIYDVHEDVPRDILVKTWILPVLRRPAAVGASAAHFLTALTLDGVIAATPVIAARFPSKKVFTIQNFPRLNEFDKTSQPYASRKPLVGYVGGISQQRGAREMIQAMSLVRDFPDARLLLAGEFEGIELESELRKLPGFERVDYRGWLAREALGNVLDRTKAGLVLFHRFQNYMEAQPNKMFEYMAAGIPVIASDFPLWRAIVGEIGCGLLVDPHSPPDIARAIEWVLRHPEEAEQMGQRGAAAVRSKYNWEAESEKLLELYSNLTNARKDYSLRHTAVTD